MQRRTNSLDYSLRSESIWLEPQIEVAWNDDFNSSEIKKILQIIKTNADQFRLQYSLHIGKRLDDK